MKLAEVIDLSGLRQQKAKPPQVGERITVIDTTYHLPCEEVDSLLFNFNLMVESINLTTELPVTTRGITTPAPKIVDIVSAIRSSLDVDGVNPSTGLEDERDRLWYEQ